MTTITQLTERIESINAFGRKILDDNGITTDGTETTYQLMGKIADISGEGNAKEEQEKVINITTNGTTEVLPDEGKTLSKVIINAYISANNHNTSYMVWGETLDFTYYSDNYTKIAEINGGIPNIGTGVYKIFVDNISYDVLVTTIDGVVFMTTDLNAGVTFLIQELDGKIYFASTLIDEGQHEIKLMKTSNVEDYVFYSQEKQSNPTTCFYLTEGFNAGTVQVSILADDELVCNTEVDLVGLDDLPDILYHSSFTIIPYFGDHIKNNKSIVIKISQRNNENILVEKTISGTPNVVNFKYIDDSFYVWGNSDLFALPA